MEENRQHGGLAVVRHSLEKLRSVGNPEHRREAFADFLQTLLEAQWSPPRLPLFTLPRKIRNPSALRILGRDCNESRPSRPIFSPGFTGVALEFGGVKRERTLHGGHSMRTQ